MFTAPVELDKNGPSPDQWGKRILAHDGREVRIIFWDTDRLLSNLRNDPKPFWRVEGYDSVFAMRRFVPICWKELPKLFE
jgi:hypothetical protein